MNKKKRNIFIFSLAMFVLFFIVLELLFPITMVLFEHGMIFGKYGESSLIELFLLIFLLIVLLLSGNMYVFTDKKKGFLSSIVVGFPFFIFSSFILFTTIPYVFDGFKAANLISLIFYCILIGLSEEFLCRAWLQNEFIERFGSNKKGILMSILISSFVFGFMHITNYFVTPQSFIDTIMQVLQAVASGFLLGSIYYRTKNIWAVAFLHGFFDFSILLEDVNLIKDCTQAEYTTPALIVSIIVSIFLIIFYVSSGTYALSTGEEPKMFKDNSKAKIISIIVLIVAMTGFISTSALSGDLTEMICYEFKEKEISTQYDVATTNRNVFIFGDKDHEFLLKEDNNKLLLSIDKEEIELSFDEDIEEFLALDNDSYVDIVINCYDTENFIYFTRLEKGEFGDNKEYLEKVKNSFIKMDSPDLKSIGYIVFDEDNNKYPYFLAYGDEELFIDKDKELYIIKKN